MIARKWTGVVLAASASEYLELMQSVAIPDYRRISGNLGAWCLHSRRGNVVEVTMLTFWRDLASIESFAGADVLRAKYYDFDDHYLLWKTEIVEHADITAGEASAALESGPHAPAMSAPN